MTEILALPKIVQEIFPLYNHVLEQCQNRTCGWSQPSIPHLLTAEVGKTIRGQNVSHTLIPQHLTVLHASHFVHNLPHTSFPQQVRVFYNIHTLKCFAHQEEEHVLHVADRQCTA